MDLAFLATAEQDGIVDGELSPTGLRGLQLARLARDRSLHSYAELAAALDTSPEQVRRRVHQARREILRAERHCVCGCGRPLMRRRRTQARYRNDACRQRAYRRRRARRSRGSA